MTVVPHTVELDGARRRLLVAAPAGGPVAIVLSLHGSTSTPQRQVQLSRMAALAEQGALVAFPQGSIPSRAGWAWDLDRDLAFLDRAVDYLRSTFGGPSAPLCISGMSGGARMATRFSASGHHPVAVLGAVAGLRRPAKQRLSSPVRVLAFHGTRDRINPYAGGRTERWSESVLDAAVGWARAHGHDPEPECVQLTPSLTRLFWGSGESPGTVTLWVCDGAGHTWPGTRLPLLARLYLGRVSNDIDATAEIWHALSSR